MSMLLTYGVLLQIKFVALSISCFTTKYRLKQTNHYDKYTQIVVALTGFEPVIQEPKSCVLPLHYRAIRRGALTPLLYKKRNFSTNALVLTIITTGKYNYNLNLISKNSNKLFFRHRIVIVCRKSS